ncbi:hypothetical protein CgunFtcFv8_002936 [Champsocephalus gunnari]|uniref:Uncharacterized protein n=1 Tax=Champsocephalus gunnari TaxID=52237 RepID=A0AAN8D9U0_CHAGU|nr:hypothetical protein CgunFtcFv8_002936 [Champsocephalus gunnari]
MCWGSLAGKCVVGGVSKPKECHAEGGELEMLLPINCRDKTPQEPLAQILLTSHMWPSPEGNERRTKY